ncbi:CitMHS family transporter [Aminipila luticellarii]|uniref:Citrate transporter n=1 Tax=Aminipila luticellarii TaxID=2507160 RepID=A0A410PTA9_9FIRM|nr:citrate:proton symporter [Aminipila luticellarii]QAT42144.1 citrate transporter [Aminipila luticellarii]
MSLALIGFLTIVIMLTLIMTKRLQTLLALILVPIIGCLVAGQGAKLGEFITEGLQNIAPTGVMFIFAILFFGVMSDAGTFDPIVKGILKVVGKDPVKICIGTFLLAAIVHLDGSGAVTFLIAIPALLPLYQKLGMRNTTLATLVALGAGIMNMLPWGGPTLRAITAMKSDINGVFIPMLIPMAAGFISILVIAVFLGRAEKKRLGDTLNDICLEELEEEADPEAEALKRPKLFPVNLILIILAVFVMLKSILPPAVVFMIGTALALIINYPNISVQKERVDSHAKAALMMASMLFAAGSFIGIMQGSGMLTAIAKAIVNFIPISLGGFIPILVGVLGVPLSLVFDPDSYYYGVLPVLSQAVDMMGGDPLAIARASIAGQMTLGFPISPLTGATFLLIGLAGVDLAEHQKKTLPLAWAASIVVVITATITGVIAF